MQDLAKRYSHITEQPLTASIEPRQCISIIDNYCSLMENSLKNRRFKRLLSATIVDSSHMSGSICIPLIYGNTVMSRRRNSEWDSIGWPL